MKKIISIVIAIVVLAIGAISVYFLVDKDNQSAENSGIGGKNSIGGNGENPVLPIGDDYDPNDPEQYIYRSVFANSPYKDQWDTSRYGADVSGVWDSTVLPSVFPAKPHSVTAIDRTEYVGKLDNKITSNPPGYLSVDYDYEGDDKPWEYYMVMFTGTMDTFNTLVADLETNFACYDNRDDSIGETRFKGEFHAYRTDLYVFMNYQENGSYNSETYEFEGDGTVWFTLYAMPVHHQLPKLVEGVPLMQAGYVMYDHTTLTCWGEGDDDYTEIPYNYQTGTATGTVKESWGVEFEYRGATTSDADAYGSQLTSAGFTCVTNDSDPYYKRYTKDNIEVIVQYYAEFKYVEVKVQTENWW